MDSPNLHIEFISNFVELFFVYHKLWKFNMDRSSQGSTKIGWARSNITKMIVMSEFGFFLDSGSSNSKSRENSTDISTLLHGDDSELILFVNPNQESLFLVVEDTSTSWPVSVETTRLQESVTLLE
jgi:hypothetical protein